MSRIVLLVAGLMVLTPARPNAPETITSDTMTYCNALAARVDHHALPPSARALMDDGQAMCARGEIAGGLRRIRMAMLILRGQTDP